MFFYKVIKKPLYICDAKNIYKTSAKNSWEFTTKKMSVELNLPNRGTGIPCTDKRAHARVVSQSAYHLSAKITSFLLETLSDSFKYF